MELAHEDTRSNDDRFVAQVSLHVGGRLLRAQRRAADAKSAVKSVAQALDQQIKRYKGQVYRSERSRQGVRGADPEAESPYADTSGLVAELTDDLEAADGGFTNG